MGRRMKALRRTMERQGMGEKRKRMALEMNPKLSKVRKMGG